MTDTEAPIYPPEDEETPVEIPEENIGTGGGSGPVVPPPPPTT